ncbi:NTP transferase domain-containing protein [Candidatus Desantisbacteria bacterium]|nr:NTP transferase domain-containing protein [Candidatus Desantisbacteria bacterium]
MDKSKLKTFLVSSNISIKLAMQKLNETAEKILFVIDKENKLLGTVSDGDIRRGIIMGLGFNSKIELIMNKKFISAKSIMPDIKKYSEKLMLDNKIEQIPVLDDQGKIVDAIFWTDVLEGEKEQKPAKVKMLSNKVVIMAGGKGTRLDPFTKILPKPLIPIGNKTIIELIMERFNNNGFNKFIYTLNYKKEYIKIFLKESNFPYSIDWIEENDFLGTAGSISLLEGKIKDTFFVANCDSLLDVNFHDVLKWHKEHKSAITIIGSHNEVKIPFGVLELSGGKLKKILEKPVHDIIINTGIYVMEPHVISYITKGKHIDMNTLIDLVGEKEKITVYPIYSGWLDIGQWEEYKKSLEILGGI